MYVADTHAFLWFLTEDKKLGKKAREIFEACDKGEAIIAIPSIVLIESLFVCEKKKLDLRFKKVLAKIQNSLNYPVYSLDLGVVILCQELEQFSDPHDRIIIATAKMLNATLITKDKKIMQAKAVKTVW